MTNPFEDSDGYTDYGDSGSPIRRPDQAYTPMGSPRRMSPGKASPSKAAMKYSPAVSFRRSDSSTNIFNNTLANNFIRAAGGDSEDTPRARFTNQESPLRAKFAAHSIAEASDNDDDDMASYSPTRHTSPFRLTSDDYPKSVTSGRSGNTGVFGSSLAPSDRLFSNSSFGGNPAADRNIDSNNPFQSIPTLAPTAGTRSSASSRQSSGTRTLSTQDTLNERDPPAQKIHSYASSVDSDSTAASEDDYDQQFSSSLDGHIMVI
ncbi:unnamed protein product [Ambrosiozyma monospora]|uniref:Unnamed protein product n=1 Tax=Ambrosiozyma monospora TaxID=43982 RepID=A0ACB5TUX9_AMBMO|nr:unnamed protein product [Ambrosiozyma monospora]